MVQMTSLGEKRLWFQRAVIRGCFSATVLFSFRYEEVFDQGRSHNPQSLQRIVFILDIYSRNWPYGI